MYYDSFLERIIVVCLNCIAPPEIVVGLNHKTVLVGEQLKLACEAIGTPKPSIIWAKDDINLESSQRVQVIQIPILFFTFGCI